MKPRAVCQSFQDEPLKQLYMESALFSALLEARGLLCRLAVPADHAPLWTFLLAHWHESMLERPHELARTLRHGFSLVLTDPDGQIVGAQLADLYADRTLQALRYALAPAYRGARLGAGLVRRHALDAMLRYGARERRGTVETTNLASLKTLLNDVGCVADGYAAAPLYEPPAFTVTLALTPMGLVANRIDQAASVEQCFRLEAFDHAITDGKDGPRIAELYAKGYHVIGVLPTGQLLAVPA